MSAEAIGSLRRKAQNEQTALALADALRDTERERDDLHAENDPPLPAGSVRESRRRAASIGQHRPPVGQRPGKLVLARVSGHAKRIGQTRRNQAYPVDAPQETPACCPIRSGSGSAVRSSDAQIGFGEYWTATTVQTIS